MHERVNHLRREERQYADVLLVVMVDDEREGHCRWDAYIERYDGSVDHVSGSNVAESLAEAVDSGLACAQRNYDGFTTESGTYRPNAEKLADGHWVAKVWKISTEAGALLETPIYPSDKRHKGQPQAFEEACAWAAALPK